MDYYERIGNAMVEGKKLGTVVDVQVRHKKWCAVFKSIVRCDCDPQVFVTVGAKKYEADNNGKLSEVKEVQDEKLS